MYGLPEEAVMTASLRSHHAIAPSDLAMRLESATRATRGLPSEMQLEALVSRVRSFSEGCLADDLTLVAVRPRLPAGPDQTSGGMTRSRSTQGRTRKAHADLHPPR